MRSGASAPVPFALAAAGTDRAVRRASPSPFTVLVSIVTKFLHLDGARATDCLLLRQPPGPRGRAPEVRTGGAAGGSRARRRRQLFGAARSAVVGDEAALLQDPADQPPTGDPDVLVDPERRGDAHPRRRVDRRGERHHALLELRHARLEVACAPLRSVTVSRVSV